MRYEPDQIRQQVEAARERLFASYAVGRPPNWSTDQRTKELICLAAWLREELTRLGVDDLGRITQEGVFYRASRSEEDLFGLTARIMNDTLAGNIERDRIPHRRWG